MDGPNSRLHRWLCHDRIVRNPTDNYTREHGYLCFLFRPLSNVLRMETLSIIVFIFLGNSFTISSCVVPREEETTLAKRVYLFWTNDWCHDRIFINNYVRWYHWNWKQCTCTIRSRNTILSNDSVLINFHQLPPVNKILVYVSTFRSVWKHFFVSSQFVL